VAGAPNTETKGSNTVAQGSVPLHIKSMVSAIRRRKRKVQPVHSFKNEVTVTG
jgi:hypothetical protein